MPFKLTLAALGLAFLVLLTGCQPANDPKEEEVTYADIKTASPETLARYNTAGAAMTGAMNSIRTSMDDPTAYTVDATNPDVTVMTFHTSANGIALNGTFKVAKADNSTVQDMVLTLTDLDDGSGNTVSGTMTIKANMKADGTGTVNITAAVTVKFVDASSATIKVVGTTVITSTEGTSTGTVTIDGVTYSISQ